jgi:predicted NBD/HSP70 family sugar kinase
MAERTPAVDLLRAVLADGRSRTTSEVCDEASLPRTTVVTALRHLQGSGSVRSGPPQSGRRGRPSRRWVIADRPGPIAVIVAAAHGTIAGVVEADGTVLARRTSGPLDHDGARGLHADSALSLLAEALSMAAVAAGDLSVAVAGVPGPSNVRVRGPHGVPSGHLRGFRIWDGERPADMLTERLHCPAVEENDANLMALGEAWCARPEPLDSTAIVVSLTNGTAAGIVINGGLHRGRSGLAGEIGHLHVDDDGAPCHCGGRGCFWLSDSIPALLDELSVGHDHPLALDRLLAEEVAGRDVARRLRRFGFTLGRRLADGLVFLDPDLVIIDGALGRASAIIVEGVRGAISEFTPPAISNHVAIEPGRLGGDAQLIGAARLAHVERLLPGASG